MKIFKTKWFVRYARRARLEDKSLYEAIERAERGIVDADLGGGLIKQRVARTGQGRSSGYRVLVAWRSRELAVFLYGFAKTTILRMTNWNPCETSHLTCLIPRRNVLKSRLKREDCRR